MCFLSWLMSLSFDRSTDLVILWLASFATIVFVGSIKQNSTSNASCFSNFSMVNLSRCASSANFVNKFAMAGSFSST